LVANTTVHERSNAKLASGVELEDECSMSMRMSSKPAVFVIMGNWMDRTSFTLNVDATSLHSSFSQVESWKK
jgi:hypothetical protein